MVRRVLVESARSSSPKRGRGVKSLQGAPGGKIEEGRAFGAQNGGGGAAAFTLAVNLAWGMLKPHQAQSPDQLA